MSGGGEWEPGRDGGAGMVGGGGEEKREGEEMGRRGCGGGRGVRERMVGGEEEREGEEEGGWEGVECKRGGREIEEMGGGAIEGFREGGMERGRGGGWKERKELEGSCKRKGV